MPEATIETLQTLQLVICQQCAIVHAVPAALLAVSADNSAPLHCPNGHAWTPARAVAESDSNGDQSLIDLHSSLYDARTKLRAAMKRLDEVTPLLNPSPLEIRRRSYQLAEQAEEKNGGASAICPICGRTKTKARLAEHIRRRHKDELFHAPKTL